MKLKQQLLLLLPMIFILSTAHGQDFINLNPGETQEINGIAVSYVAAKKKTKKGEDLYRVTVSITNHGGDYIQVFPMAKRIFVKKDENALAYIQFTNATGRGMSATSGKLYSNPMVVQVPISCLKCPPPTNPKADKYTHTIKNYVVGTRFLSGSTISRAFNVRVSQGGFPNVRVMIK
jgi:hypothetical protein